MSRKGDINMKQKYLSKWLKMITIITGIIGTIIYFVVIINLVLY